MSTYLYNVVIGQGQEDQNDPNDQGEGQGNQEGQDCGGGHKINISVTIN